MDDNRSFEKIENDKNMDGKYNQVITEITTIRSRLSDLRKKKELLPYSDNKKINIVVSLMGVLTFLFLVNLYMGLKSYILFINSQTILMNVLSIVVGIPIIGLVDVIFFKKVMRVLQQKSYNRIVDSLEYKQLMEEIKSTSKLLDEKILEETNILREILEYKSKSAVRDAEINIRSVLSSYSDLSIVDSKKRIRIYTRRLVNKRSIK